MGISLGLDCLVTVGGTVVHEHNDDGFLKRKSNGA